MAGHTTASVRDPSHPGYVYYACPHNPANPRHVAANPDHPTTIRVREDTLQAVIAREFAVRIFGPDRATLLAHLLPATAADDTARKEQQAAALRKRLKQIDASEDAHIREVQALADLPAASSAVQAMRSRHLARFTELEDERGQINHQLTTLASSPAQGNDPALLDALPLLGDILTGASPRRQQQLYQVFDLQLLYNKQMHQVTIQVTITPSTPAAIINDSQPPTTGPVMHHSAQPNRSSWLAQP